MGQQRYANFPIISFFYLLFFNKQLSSSGKARVLRCIQALYLHAALVESSFPDHVKGLFYHMQSGGQVLKKVFGRGLFQFPEPGTGAAPMNSGSFRNGHQAGSPGSFQVYKTAVFFVVQVVSRQDPFSGTEGISLVDGRIVRFPVPCTGNFKAVGIRRSCRKVFSGLLIKTYVKQGLCAIPYGIGGSALQDFVLCRALGNPASVMNQGMDHVCGSPGGSPDIVLFPVKYPAGDLAQDGVRGKDPQQEGMSLHLRAHGPFVGDGVGKITTRFVFADSKLP